MARTRAVRADLALSTLKRLPPAEEQIAFLGEALRLLEAIPGGRVDLDAARQVELDLSYETSELRKDIVFLRDGPEALLAHLAEVHGDLDFLAEVERVAAALGDRQYNAFITDRDGTINNYCARYRSSIQSAYNAVLLTRFVRERARSAAIITSGPLEGPGILDLVTEPRGTFIYGASKGREYLDRGGERRAYPIESGSQELLDELNRRLADLLSRPEREKFALIGSGFQIKFGQTTVARQDITRSVSTRESVGFLREVADLVRDLDPDGKSFVIEDTELDIEIILTLGPESQRDFDKGDGLRFLEEELDLKLDLGGNLVAGDTGSDVRMIEAAFERSPETRAVMVTRKAELADRVKALDPRALIVAEPDILVVALGEIAGAFDR